MLPLEGVSVLDLSHNAPGQFCTMVLGDLGADVFKVERPMLGDRAKYERVVSGISSLEDERRHVTHNALERNKRSVALDLKHPEARSIFHRLVQEADVVVEGFRPGVVKRLGADYQTIVEMNPRIVYCSISGYGQDGPYRDMAGHDINYISMAGVLGLIGHDEEGPPAIPPNLIGDYAGGSLISAIAIMAAFIARQKTGLGQYLDMAMTDGVFYMMAAVVADYSSRGLVPRRMEMPLNGGTPYCNVYRTSDGKYISIAAIEPWFWENLCRTLGREDLVPHQLAGGDKRQEISRFLSETFRSRTRDEWFEFLKDKDVSVGKVNSLEEAMADPQMVSRGMVAEVETPDGSTVKQPGIAIRLSGTPGKIRSTGSVTGQHTREVLLGLGYSDERIDALREEKAIQVVSGPSGR